MGMFSPSRFVRTTVQYRDRRRRLPLLETASACVSGAVRVWGDACLRRMMLIVSV